jgi:diguanylate cyclase (GGDEF)-like protein
VEGLLALTAILAGAHAAVLRSRERRLLARLESREREGHFLSESPDIRQILRHAFAAGSGILPISRFDLYRVDGAGRVEEVWTVPQPQKGEAAEPILETASPHLGERIDSARLLELTATETEHSFAPRDLLAGGPDTRRLRLPLYSGDRLIAHLDLRSSEPIDDSRKGEIRALLPPLTASLHALRNWTIAVTDELSGLASRRYFETRLSEEWTRRCRYGGGLALACFDLDQFKKLNDSLGHAAGDQAIRRFGQILRSVIRSSDLACRYGGEEFAVLFPETGLESAYSIAERVRLALAGERLEFEGQEFQVTVSAGVVEASVASDREQFMHRADEALYAAKTAGRNIIVVSSGREEEGTTS